MIYCSSLNIIFIKTKKVGGTSFEIALSKYCDHNDIITPISSEDEEIRKHLGFQSPINYLESDRLDLLRSLKVKGNFRNHMSADLIYKNLGKDLFKKSVKVSIQRNPLDFLISMYFYDIGKKNSNEQEFKQWLKSNYKLVRKNYVIAPKLGKYKADIILNYENLLDDIKKHKIFPKDFISTFEKIKAKGSFRSKKIKTSESFFIENQCEEWINKIYKLTELKYTDYLYYRTEKMITRIVKKIRRIWLR